MALVGPSRAPRLQSVPQERPFASSRLLHPSFWLLSGVMAAMACSSQERPYADHEGEGGSGGEGAKPSSQAGTSSGESGSSGAGNGEESACSPNPCEHAGACTPAGDAFECECAGGYSGERCEVVPEPCVDEPCENGGTCTADGDSFECECVDGFEGETCDTNTDDCSPNPCKNGGACKDEVSGFTCQCEEGWLGDTCTGKLFESVPMLDGASACYVEALSGNGGVAVGYCVVGGIEQAFWWKPSIGTAALPTVGDSHAYGVSHDGTIVVGSHRAPNQSARAARWVNGSGGTFLAGLDHGEGAVAGYATAITDDGKTMVGYSESSNGSPRGVSWENNEGPVLLGNGFGEIYALSVSGDGSVVAGYGMEAYRAIRWTLEDGWKGLPVGVDQDAGGRAVSHDGKVIVGWMEDQATRWIGTSEPELLGIVGSARGVNEDGSVIVGFSGATAMIWVEGEGPKLVEDVLYELAPSAATGWTLSSAEAISANGHVIAGNGKLDGVERVWLARR